MLVDYVIQTFCLGMKGGRLMETPSVTSRNKASIRRRQLILCVTLLGGMLFVKAPMHAQDTVTYPLTFSYTGQLKSVDNVAWEPDDEHNHILGEGFHIAFWGAPDPAAGCPVGMKSGAVTTDLF